MNRFIRTLLSTATAMALFACSTIATANAAITRRSPKNVGQNMIAQRDDNLYFISPACAPNSMIDVSNNDWRSCTNIHLWGMNYTYAQQFQIDYQGKDYYGEYVTIRKASTNNKVLDVSGGVVSAGRNVWLYEYNGTLAQQWYLKSAGNGRYYIVSRLNRNYVLDISGAGSANGTNIQIWPKNGTSAQLFTFSTCTHEHLKRGFFVHDSLTIYSQCADCGAIYNYATWVLPDKDNKGY